MASNNQLSLSFVKQHFGFGQWAQMICKHGRFDKESKNIDDFGKKISNETSRMSQPLLCFTRD